MRIVTLTSDFGTSDGYVGAMKGVILTRAPGVQVVDIAHGVPPFDVAAGAYCLRQAAPHFPEGTVHVAVVDPGVGTERKAVIADDGRFLYVAPDNGILTLAVPEPKAVYAIESRSFMRADISTTFHGRDIFAVSAGLLASGVPPSQAGPPTTLRPLPVRAPTTYERDEQGTLRARVIYVDRFGNLITGCPGAVVPGRARVEVGDRVIRGLRRTFAEAAGGELLAYIGSAGTLEIAVREDSAASVLGLGPGAEVVIASDDSEGRE